MPLVVAFFFNLSLLSHSRGSQHRSTTARSKIHHKLSVDPLTYNVAKALVTWLVYGQGVRLFSFFSDSTVARVDAALPGGHYGVLVGAGVGALASLYEAVLQN